LLLLILLLWFHPAAATEQANPRSALLAHPIERSSLTGVYRIDIPASDRLYSIVAGASSKLPFGEQQRFFIDLAVRLTPPDLLAIEQQGTHISLGSSRAPRMTFVADGVVHNNRAADGHVIHVRLSLEQTPGKQRLVFASSGRTEDNFSVDFESIDNGRRLRVVRQIAAEGLDQPLVIRTVYNKISEVANWELYGEAQVASASASPSDVTSTDDAAATTDNTKEGATVDASAAVLRSALNNWISATNNRDIDQQMSFYVPRLKRFYLMSDASKDFVREEKARVFAAASVNIRAAEPEIIFQDAGRTAVMRYRKQYRIENGRQSRRGEVVQELRWQRLGNEWRIFSERDIRVLK
jgi:hypothetical protein